jgi:hypothetical protein
MASHQINPNMGVGPAYYGGGQRPSFQYHPPMHHGGPIPQHMSQPHYGGGGNHQPPMNPPPHQFGPSLSSVHVGNSPLPQPQSYHGHHHNNTPNTSYHNIPPLQHAPHHGVNHHGAGSPANPPQFDRSHMRNVAAAPLLSSAILCVATGPLEGVKSQLCRLMEETKDFKHLPLEDQFDDEGKLVLSRLEMLERQLSESLSVNNGKPKGFVIENAVARTKHEIFLVDDILRRHKVRLQAVVLLNTTGVADEPDYVKHPIGFEVCARFVSENNLIVVEPEDPATFSATEALEKLIQGNPKVFEFSSDPLPAELDVPQSDMPLPTAPVGALTLLRDAKLNFQMLRAVAAVLKMGDPFTSCWTSAARVLEYSFFTRRSHYLRSFFATPLIDGERVALIGYGRHVYMMMGPTGLSFRLDVSCLPPSFARLVNEPVDDESLSFVLTAVAGEGKSGSPTIFLADAVYMQGAKGTALFAEERLALLNKFLSGDSTHNGITYHCVSYHTVQDTVPFLSRPGVFGLSLINPGFAAPGTFERQNFIWWSTDYKNFDVRLWNGHTRTIQNEEWWFFEALVLDGDGEGRLTYGTNLETTLYVAIPDSVVSQEWINDGNVVEISVESTAPRNKTPGAAKGAANTGNTLPPTYLKFVKRRNFLTHPTSRVFADVLSGTTAKWPKDSFSRSASYLTQLPIARRVEEPSASEKPEFA